METTIVLPDIQHPFEDKLMLKKLIAVVKHAQPSNVIQIGDGIDFKEVSRWTKGTAEEYKPTLQKNIDGFAAILSEIRDAAPRARIKWLRGNHDERLEQFVKQYASPLGTLRNLETSALFGLEEKRVDYVRGPIRVGTNLIALHGHECGGYSSTPSAWDAKFTKRYGSHNSFVFGHTHQPFLISRAIGFGGSASPRFTMNAGSIMDPRQVDYVKDGSVSWTMSFGVIHDDGKRVYPELILATDRGFFYNGTKW